MERWARFLVRRRWWVLGASLLIMVVLGVTSFRFGGDFSDTFRIPGSESQQAFDLLEDRFAQEAGSDARVIWTVESGTVFDDDVQGPMTALLAEAASLDGVVFVANPYAVPGLVSADQRSAFATVRFQGQPRDIPDRSTEALLGLADEARRSGLAVEVGGRVVTEFESEGPGESEVIGVIAAAVVLLVAFGSIIAIGLPLLTALVGLAVGIFLIRFVAIGMDISSFAPSFAAMLGIGVGIDYALFVVTRFREGLAAGWTVERSVVTAVTTAGRSVAFAGAAVVAALLALFAIGIPFVANLGLSAAIVVAVAVVVALTLLPALLAVIGTRIDKWSVPFLRTSVAGNPTGSWYRFSMFVQRHALVFLIGGTAVLLLLAAPLLDAELGTSDEGNNPERFASRRAYDLLADAFGAGFNGPFLIVVEDDEPLSEEGLLRLRKAVSVTQNVANVAPPSLNSAGDTAVLTVIPGTAPQDAETRALVERLRNETVPSVLRRMDGQPQVLVAGLTAAFVDVTSRIEDRLPPFFAIVIGFSIVLLLAAFRSIVVPIKAAVMNLLAIASSIGFTVMVFQWGWGADLIGVGKTGPIEAFLPMFMFAILFGLSMDYEVFLLSRIRERYLVTGDASESVAHGISASARVITAAAAILVTVFGSFLLGDERVIKEFGLGLAFAIFIDATLVRLVLVPAAMQIMGRWNWWLPGWLDRIVPRISIDPAPEAQPDDRVEVGVPVLAPTPGAPVRVAGFGDSPSVVTPQASRSVASPPPAHQASQSLPTIASPSDLPPPTPVGQRAPPERAGSQLSSDVDQPAVPTTVPEIVGRWLMIAAALTLGFVVSYRARFAHRLSR
jgi:RND superfamily putative drug exporter